MRLSQNVTREQLRCIDNAGSTLPACTGGWNEASRQRRGATRQRITLQNEDLLARLMGGQGRHKARRTRPTTISGTR